MKESRLVANLYNPHQQSPEELIDGFVVRQKIFHRIFREIKEEPMQTPPQHLLVVGQRGMGKTTLLLRLSYEIERDKDLSTWLIPLVFTEEQYGLNSLASLWEQTAKYLEDKQPDFVGLFDKIDAAFDPDQVDRYEEHAFQLITQVLHAQQVKLVLFIDNINDILVKLNERDSHRLREVLQTSTDVRIIGASSATDEAFFRHDKPFFEFFKLHRLEGLNKPETEELLLKLGEFYKEESIKQILEETPGRVETLRRLTGGVIRTIVLLFEIFVDNQKGGAFMDLQLILDRVTPLYKHRMDDLPAQQQQIINAVALAWDAVSTKEIAQKTRLESKKISAQMKPLVKHGVIRKIETDTKNHFYQLSERFFNIWYLMRFGRKYDTQRVIWLTRFLESWCDNQTLAQRAKRHLAELREGSYAPDAAHFLSEAIAKVDIIEEGLQHEILTETRRFLSEASPDIARYVSKSERELKEDGSKYFNEYQYKTSLKVLLKTKQQEPETLRKIGVCYLFGEKDYQKSVNYLARAIGLGSERAIFNMAQVYIYGLKDKMLAEKWLQKSTQFDYAKENEDRIGDTLNLWGQYYSELLKDYTKAEGYYHQAIEAGEEYALRNLGDLYADKLKDHEQAEHWLKQASEHVYQTKNAHKKGESLNSLAIFYENNLQDYAQAEVYYHQAIEAGDEYALRNLGNLYANKLKDHEQAEHWLKQAVEHVYQAENAHKKGDSLNRLAVFYENNLQDYAQAEVYYHQAIEAGEEYALKNLGDLYADKLKDHEQAEHWLKQAAEHVYQAKNAHKKGESLNSLAWFYENNLQDYAQAEVYYHQAIEAGEEYALKNLGVLYANKLKDHEQAEHWLKQAAEHVYQAKNAHKKGESLNSLALFYENNLHDYAQAEVYYHQAIEAGEEYALKNLGDLYADKLKDHEQAEHWLKQAAEHVYQANNAHKKGESLNSLALFYENNLHDYAQAEVYYHQAIEAENEYALRNLGRLYAHKLKDHEQAEHWLKQAAEHVYQAKNAHKKGESLNSLALFYENNLHDYAQAEVYYHQAIEAGEEYALKNLGDLYADKLKDHEQAEHWLKQAAEHVYQAKNAHKKGESLNSLALFYENNLHDYAQAEVYYHQAIEAENEYALRNLGRLYAHKLKDHEQAEHWLKQAAEHVYQANNAHKKGESLNSLALFYENNLHDYAQAEVYYHQAIEAENEYALRNLGRLYANKLKDHEQAEHWLKQAAEHVYQTKNAHKKGESLNSLAWFYENNLQDYAQAEVYYHQAIEAGEEYALRNLGVLYAHKLKDHEHAEHWLKQASEHVYQAKNAHKKGESLNSLAWFYYKTIQKPHKALHAARQSFKSSKDIHKAHTYASIQAWVNQLEESWLTAQYFLYEPEAFREFPESIATYLSLIVAKGGTKYLHEFFEGEQGHAFNTREKFAPIWFAFVTLNQDDYPNEHLRMGPELKQTVDEILDTIADMKVDYAYDG